MTVVPCPYCENGVTDDSNGARWSCWACRGRGEVFAESLPGPVQRDFVDFDALSRAALTPWPPRDAA